MAPPAAASATLLHAAALQDHLGRLLQMPGRLPHLGAVPTLAQRLRLVAGPVALSAQQWEAVHAHSLRRGDSCCECSICLQLFKTEEQVLLSCSHVFHRACLASFERFSQARCCPLCRCQAYQKKRVDDGARFFRERCAMRIQAAWRGHRARRQFRVLRDAVPPQHPALRRRWLADRLQHRSERLVGALLEGSPSGGPAVAPATTTEIDVLFAELEATSRQSRAIYSKLAERVPGEGGDAAPPSLVVQPHSLVRAPALAAAGDTRGGRDGSSKEQPTSQAQGPAFWEAVIARAIDRDDDPECAICLAPLVRATPSGGRSEGGGSCRSGGIAVLSCSHAFHSDCLGLFEAFQLASEAAPRCPCCRAGYARIQLQ